MFIYLTAAVVALSGTASADPMGDLKDNPLFQGSKLTNSCAKKLVKGTTRASSEKYVTALVSCLDKTWRPHLKPLYHGDVPGLRIVKDAQCANSDEKSSTSLALFCKDLQVQVESDWIKARDDHAVLREVTWAYGRFVQQAAGITRSYLEFPSDDAENVWRRPALLSDCLGAAFMKSVWTAQKRSGKEWKVMLTGLKKDELTRSGLFGKAASRVHWYTQGFKTGSPASCNVWKASSSKVA
ncbi:hypothetical protein [Nonomuraea sp. NPDC050310]|uniref:hypothetical protein n=1 Tax=Nonomuraea sp. NPDC050310 TaxID=3154935 RepID=UPI0033D87AD3